MCKGIIYKFCPRGLIAGLTYQNYDNSNNVDCSNLLLVQDLHGCD